MDLSMALTDAGRAIGAARELIQRKKGDLKSVEQNLKASKDQLMNFGGKEMTEEQGRQAQKMLHSIKSAGPSRQLQEAVGAQSAMEPVLRALSELQKTLEKLKADTEQKKRTVSGTHESSL